MIYLGTLGRMVGLKCPASQQVAVDERITFEQTLGGRKVGQISPGNPKRVWQNQLSDASTPAQAGAVMAFINGEWGNGPFIYVSADAPVTNLLTPSVASCDPILAVAPGLAGGPLLTPDGWAGRSYLNANPADPLWFGTAHTPVLEGTSVTASAYLIGAGARVRLYFYDALGANISTHLSGVPASAGAVVRSWVTTHVPPGAASCRLLAVNATAGARPAITWTSSLVDWADGQGCAKAVIHSASRSLVMASREPRGGRFSNLSFTITEVG